MARFPDYLRIVVHSNKKIIQINKTTTIENIVLDRVDVEFTKILAQYLGFAYELRTPLDNELGRLLPNGTWTGMVKMVLQGEADLIVSILSLSEDRSEVLDFSYPYHKASITFITRKAEYESDFTVFLTPFSFEVWLCTLITYFFITTILYMKFKRKYSLQNILLDNFGRLVRQSNFMQSTKISDSVLISTWIVGGMFISFCYSADLLSFLTIPPLRGVRTIPELAAQVAKGIYECTTYPGTFIVDALATSDDPYSRIIGRSLLRNKGSHDIDGVLRNFKPSKKPAFVGGRQHFMPLETKYFVSKDEFIPALQAIWMRNDFCCKKDLDRFVSHVWSSGIYQKLIDFDGFLSSLKILLYPNDVRKKERCLTVNDLKGAFVLLILGYVFAFLTLILEITVNKFCNRHDVITIKTAVDSYGVARTHKKKFSTKRKKALKSLQEISVRV